MCRDQCPHHDNLSGRDDRAAVAVESPMPTVIGKELLVVELGSDLLSVAAAAAAPPPPLHHRSSLSYCCSSCSQCRSSPHHRHSTVLTVGRMVSRLGVSGVDRELGFFLLVVVWHGTNDHIRGLSTCLSLVALRDRLLLLQLLPLLRRLESCVIHLCFF